MIKQGVLSVLIVVLLIGLSGMAQADLNTGLVAYYPFDGNADDVSGNGYDGTISGATLVADSSANPDSAYFFNGVSDVLEINNIDVPDTEITLSIWFNLASYERNGESTLFDKHGAFLLHVEDNGIRFRLMGVGVINSLIIPALNTWNHIVATYNGNMLKIYLNNSLVVEGIASGLITSSLYPLYIASDEAGIYHYMNGSVDDARIYNRALSESEIQQLYNGDSDCHTQADVDAAYQSGRQACIDDPASCGISTDVGNCESTASYDIWTGVLTLPDLMVGSDSWYVELEQPYNITSASPNN